MNAERMKRLVSENKSNQNGTERNGTERNWHMLSTLPKQRGSHLP
jgi:hypothetical protein